MSLDFGSPRCDALDPRTSDVAAVDASGNVHAELTAGTKFDGSFQSDRRP